LSKGYKVVGLERRSSSPDYANLLGCMNNENFLIEECDITDMSSVSSVIRKHMPDEIYNLAAQSFVASSWTQPIATFEINTLGTLNFLESMRQFSPDSRFYQASTSECYGEVLETPQNESTPTNPVSPYAASKCASEDLIKVYRQSYGLFACYGRLFNHESVRRSKQFVTRKITSYIGHCFKIVENNVDKIFDIIPGEVIPTDLGFRKALHDGLISTLKLGNLDAQRDWSDARDMVRGMWMMLQQDVPNDYVLASGETRTVREFLDHAFSVIGIDDWSDFVEIDPKFYRPVEVNLLLGDCSLAKKDLGWYPKYSFGELVESMVRYDCGLITDVVICNE
jgi:GDPmannose 4,6-dehydratase